MAVAVAALLVSCGGKESAKVWQTENKIHVAATTTIVADLARVIGGDEVEVKGLMDADTDPHDYQKTSEDNVILNTAKVVFYSGLHLEAHLEEGFEQRAKKGEAVYAVSAKLPKDSILMDGGEADPHFWANPELWTLAVDVVVEGLAKADPANKTKFEERGAAYKKELTELKAWIAKRVVEVPEKQRVLVTAHDAFGYFGSTFGFEVRGLQGLSSADAAGLNAANELVSFIKERNIKTIFAEKTANSKGLESVATDSGAKVSDVHLWADGCDAEGKPAGSYLKMMKHNVNSIVDRLK